MVGFEVCLALLQALSAACRPFAYLIGLFLSVTVSLGAQMRTYARPVGVELLLQRLKVRPVIHVP